VCGVDGGKVDVAEWCGCEVDGVDGGTLGDGMGCSLSDCTLIDESDKLTALPLWEIPHFQGRFP
jgi:hypothetical protein